MESLKVDKKAGDETDFSTPADSSVAPSFESWELSNKKTISYKWSLHHFSSSTQITGERIESQLFPDKDRPQWRLQLSPRGESENSADFISLAVVLVSSKVTTVDAQVKFALLDAKGKQCHELIFKETLQKNSRVGYTKFINRNVLSAKEKGFLVNDTLTVLCEIITTSNSSSKQQDTQLPPVAQFATDDLGSLLDNKTFCDVSIFVGDYEFSAHKLILAARSPTMAAMFQQQMKESDNDYVVVTDVSREIFDALLRFVYTGRVEKLEEKAEELLKASNKYQLDHLKVMCEDEIVRKITPNNAIKYLILADQHSAYQLRDKTIEFINHNAADVIRSADWASLIKSHPYLVAEIYIKAIDMF